MAKFLVRRIIFLIFSLIFVSIAIFVITELAPGNIAVNTLGNTITPEQEQSFNAQNGLDQSATTRYVRWLIGSDWQAEDLTGHPVTRVVDENNNRFTWWAVANDGTLFQNFTDDGETIMRRVRQTDGAIIETQSPDDVWTKNEEGVSVFWGIDDAGHAAMWVQGDDQETWTLTSASWTSAAGAPRQYIPLQRGLLRGDPGVSFKDRRPVSETLFRRLQNTAILAGTAFIRTHCWFE
jgi:peptide/nickel transport system permease protein